MQYVAALLSTLAKRVNSLTQRVDDLEHAETATDAAIGDVRQELANIQSQAYALDSLIGDARTFANHLKADYDDMRRYQSKQGREIGQMQRQISDTNNIVTAVVSALKPALPFLRRLTRAIEDTTPSYNVEAEMRAINHPSDVSRNPEKHPAAY